MPRNGGVYTLPEGDFIFDTVIDEIAMNNILDDIETALSQSVASDGQTVISSNLPMAGYKHTGVGNAGTRTEYLTAGQFQDDSLVWCGAAGGTANAITLAPTIPVTTLLAGQKFRFIGNAFSDGAITAVISGLPAKDVYSDNRPCSRFEIWLGRFYEILYDGTRFHLQLLNTRPVDVRRNYILNPHFAIAQLGPTITVAAATPRYSLDQWYHVPSAGAATTVTRQAMTFAEPILPYEQPYYIRLVSTAHGRMTQPIEDVRTLAGQPITFTFFARCDVPDFEVSPDVVQFFGTGGSADVVTDFSATPRTLSTTWQRFRQTVNVPSIEGKTVGAGSCLTIRLVHEADVPATIEYAYMQLEGGGSYTFMDARSLSEEYTLCQRLFQSSYPYDVPVGTATYIGSHQSQAVSTEDLAQETIRFTLPLRTSPTITIWSTQTADLTGSYYAPQVAEHLQANLDGVSNTGFIAFQGPVAFTVGRRYRFHWTADARL